MAIFGRRKNKPRDDRTKRVISRDLGSIDKFQVNDKVTLNRKQYDSLYNYIQNRLQFGKQARDQQIQKYEKIDREIAGYLVLDQDDKKRELDNRKGYGIKPVDVKLPLVLAQLDEATTYILSVTAPEDGMYNAIAPRQEQPIAKGFTSLMNKQGEIYNHYGAMARGIFDMLKYNFGGWVLEWDEQEGNVIKNDGTGLDIKIEKDIVKQGNELESIDVYNFLYDVSVEVTDIAEKGEFFAAVDVVTPFRVKKMAADGEVYNSDLIMGVGDQSYEVVYYQPKPTITVDPQFQDRLDWVSLFQMEDSDTQVKGAMERVYLYIWLPGAQYGLKKKGELKNDKQMQIYRVLLINGIIGRVDEMDNAHGMLPIMCGMPLNDGFRMQTKSYAEHLIPYQTFASYQMNVHQQAARKALYGLTIYMKDVIPQMESADLLGGKVPSASGTQIDDIHKAVAQFRDVPDTSNTVNDIKIMDELMQKILPTKMLEQVASLQRATQYQAAATVQGANRRNLKIARTIDNQALSPGRRMQMYNIFQYMTEIRVLQPDGTLYTLPMDKARVAGIEFTISDGLKGIDKLIIIESIKEVLNAILQSQTASQQLDVVGIIDWWTSMIGDRTDFTQFKYASPIDSLSPQLKQTAFQLLQQYEQQQKQGGGQQGNGQQQPPVDAAQSLYPSPPGVGQQPITS